MDDIRDTRPWFWILILAVLAVAVVGLVIAISANNSSVDEKKVVDEAIQAPSKPPMNSRKKAISSPGRIASGSNARSTPPSPVAGASSTS